MRNSGIYVIAGVLALVCFMLGFLAAFVYVNNSEKAEVAVEQETVSAESPSDGASNEKKFKIGDNFEKVGVCGWDDFFYYRDKVTDVMYVCYLGYNRGGLVEMTDPNTGLPLTYQNYLKYQEAMANER